MGCCPSRHAREHESQTHDGLEDKTKEDSHSGLALVGLIAGSLGRHGPRQQERSRGKPKGRAMAYIITEPCIGTKDKSCVDVCPVDCIHGGDSDDMLFIDPEVCIDCGACISACPVEAIFADSDIPEKWQNFV